MKKMSRKVFLIICGVCYFSFYIACKLFLLFNIDLYSNNTSNLIYSKGETYNINYNKCSDCFTSKDGNVKMNNYFDKFELGDDNDEFEYYISEDGNSAIYIGEGKSLFSQIDDYNENTFFYELNHFPMYISNSLRHYILNKYDIKDDVSLIKKSRNVQSKNNLFTPVIKMKENYLFNYILNMTYNSKDIIYVTGKYKGYIMINDNGYYITLCKDNKNYYINLHNRDYFTREKLESILNSISLK